MGCVKISNKSKNNKDIKSLTGQSYSYYDSEKEIEYLDYLLTKYGYRLGTKEEKYKVTKYEK